MPHRGEGGSGCRSAPTRPGSTGCSRTPGCTRRAWTSPTCSARARPATCGRCAPRPGSRSSRSTDRRSSSSGATTATRPTGPTATTTTARAWTTARGRSTAPPTTRAGLRARPRARGRLRRAGRRPPARRRGRGRARGLRAGHRAARPLVVRGPVVAARPSSSECERQGLELVHLDDALEAVEPAPAPAQLPVTTWGTPRDLSTWDGRGVEEFAWRARAAELDVVAAGRDASVRAVRELLALQSSDWAFLVQRDLAAAYGHARAEGHGERLRTELATVGCLPADAAQPGAACVRGAAALLSGPACPDPLLGVPADRRGRSCAPRPQALRAARAPRRRRSTCSLAACGRRPSRRTSTACRSTALPRRHAARPRRVPALGRSHERRHGGARHRARGERLRPRPRPRLAGRRGRRRAGARRRRART